MTLFDFAKLYAKIFKEEESLISSGKLRFPVTKDFTSSEEDVDHYYHIDNINLEGFLDLNMPTVEQSLDFTLKNFNGLLNKNQACQNQQSTTFE